MKIRYAAVMAKHILIHVWLPHRGRVYSITANVGQAGISVEETVSVKVVSTATFQTEIVVTLLGENASPSLLGKTVMALQITKFAAVTTNSTRITAKPISRAGRVFKIQAAAPMNLLLSKSPTFCCLVHVCKMRRLLQSVQGNFSTMKEDPLYIFALLN
mmetsp:Transcript_6402/g.10021  ORF Transcript_6402/g.10021 Transcript_6402/m.10021 type:complete len:159 (+) Transcript_6402:83-559(+)